MRFFRDLPLRQKLLWIILAASGATLLFSGFVVLVYELTLFRPGVESRLNDRVELVRGNLTAALALYEPDFAADELEGLVSGSDVRAACLYDGEGNPYAEYVDPGFEFTCPASAPPPGDRFQRDTLIYCQSLIDVQSGDRVGSLYALCPLPPLLVRLPQYYLMLGSVVFALLTVSLLLRWGVQRLISGPILRLAQAARDVRDREDYGVRVKKSADDEVGELTEAFNDMLATIERHTVALRKAYQRQEVLQEQLVQARKMESIGRLAGGVAHDFNNYLTVIVGSTDLTLAQLPPDSPSRRLLENIRKATGQATNLTQQLLAFARQQIIEPRVIDPNRLVLDLEKMLRSLVGDNVELAVIPHGDVWPIRADPNQMSQVLMNLVVNARDAMPGGGKITIETHNVSFDDAELELAPGEYVLLEVADTGTGIPPEARKHLFEPFFTTKDLGKGTGLGLATCYGIVKQSGGHIRVESEPGRGSVFKIYLARSRAGKVDSLAAALPQDLPSGQETVLVVEDNALVRQTAVSLLRAQGYTVLEAAGGPDALRLVEQNEQEIDLLVTDVVMPQMSGKVVAEKLQQMRPGLRVLFVSGYADVIAAEGELEAGIDFLQKPYTSEALMYRVRMVLDGKRGR